jgi:hypothetical protein
MGIQKTRANETLMDTLAGMRFPPSFLPSFPPSFLPSLPYLRLEWLTLFPKSTSFPAYRPRRALEEGERDGKREGGREGGREGISISEWEANGTAIAGRLAIISPPQEYDIFLTLDWLLFSLYALRALLFSPSFFPSLPPSLLPSLPYRFDEGLPMRAKAAAKSTKATGLMRLVMPALGWE